MGSSNPWRRLIPTLVLGPLVLEPATIARSQDLVPLGMELQVNTYTTNDQDHPSVSAVGGDGFVVVWESTGSAGSDQDGRSIQAQQFASDGTALGVEQQVNTGATGSQRNPSVSQNGGSGFVVAWESDSSTGSDDDQRSIQARIFGSDGAPMAEQFQVNSFTTGYQSHAMVGPDGGDGFVVVWESTASAGSDTLGGSIQAQRFSSDGTPLGDPFQVNTTTPGYQADAAIASDAAGGFVVVWESPGSAGSDSDALSIQSQRYDSDGTPVGGEAQVNLYTTGDQARPAVGSDGGNGFVVVWESYGTLGDDDQATSIQAQRFGSDGAPLGTQFQVNTYTSSFQVRPSVGPDGAGGFVVAWASFGSVGSDDGVFSVQAQRYSSDGAPAGAQFQVNSYTVSVQNYPVVAPKGGIGFVVAWQSTGSFDSDRALTSIHAQPYATPGPVPAPAGSVRSMVVPFLLTVLLLGIRTPLRRRWLAPRSPGTARTGGPGR